MNTEDLKNLDELRSFLDSQGIGYEEKEEEFSFTCYDKEKWIAHMQVLTLDNPRQKIELRYIPSQEFRIDTTKRFGQGYGGIPKNFFGQLSQKKKAEGIRVIYIKDYEMTEETEFKCRDKSVVKGYRRKWLVLQSYIRNACGKQEHRIFARDCEVVELDPAEASEFLSKYCFYGKRGATLSLGLKLKKDKDGLKKGTLLFLTSFGWNFYGNKVKKGAETSDKNVEVIRVGTLHNTQVIGGASKLLKHFLTSYMSLTTKSGNEVELNKIVFYVDADHNDGSSMSTLGYTFRKWDDVGFHNFALEDIDIPQLKVKKNQCFQRKPMIHKKIMELMQQKKVISIGTAGTIVYDIDYKTFVP